MRISDKLPNSSIVVSLDLSTFSTSDLDSIISKHSDFYFIKNSSERLKTYSMFMTKVELINLLQHEESKKLRLKVSNLVSTISKLDASYQTTVIELVISCGRFMEFKLRSGEYLDLDEWYLEPSLYTLAEHIITNRMKFYNKKYITMDVV